MPWNLLILPLLAGYYYCTQSYSQKYRYRRLDGHRFLLGIAFQGFLFLAAAVLLVVVARFGLSRLVKLNTPGAAQFLASWHPLYPHLGKTLLSLLLAVAWTQLRNRKHDEREQRVKVIGDEGLHLEALFLRAYTESKPILISLKGGKVYVCRPLEGTHPTVDHAHIPVIPLRSGVRNKDTQQIEFKTDYEAIYDRLHRSGQDALVDDFELILPMSEILSATLFDLELYRTLFPEATVDPLFGLDD